MIEDLEQSINPLDSDNLKPVLDVVVEVFGSDLIVSAEPLFYAELAFLAAKRPGLEISDAGRSRIKLRFPPVIDPLGIAMAVKAIADKMRLACQVVTVNEATKRSSELRAIRQRYEEEQGQSY